MNHKRGRPKSRRAGCLFCKPHKHQRVGKVKRQTEGGCPSWRAARHTAADLRAYQ